VERGDVVQFYKVAFFAKNFMHLTENTKNMSSKLRQARFAWNRQQEERRKAAGVLLTPQPFIGPVTGGLLSRFRIRLFGKLNFSLAELVDSLWYAIYTLLWTVCLRRVVMPVSDAQHIKDQIRDNQNKLNALPIAASCNVDSIDIGKRGWKGRLKTDIVAFYSKTGSKINRQGFGCCCDKSRRMVTCSSTITKEKQVHMETDKVNRSQSLSTTYVPVIDTLP